MITRIIRIIERDWLGQSPRPSLMPIAKLSTQEQETYQIFDWTVLESAKIADLKRSWVELTTKRAQHGSTVYLTGVREVDAPV